jgi:hypothetical protein
VLTTTFPPSLVTLAISLRACGGWGRFWRTVTDRTAPNTSSRKGRCSASARTKGTSGFLLLALLSMPGERSSPTALFPSSLSRRPVPHPTSSTLPCGGRWGRSLRYFSRWIPEYLLS